jgi:hypothetical protein
MFPQLAPTWLSQLSTLLSAEQRHALSAQLHGVTHERMLRELADVVAALSTERPLVLVLEDLHWSDAATIEALAYLVRRQEPNSPMGYEIVKTLREFSEAARALRVLADYLERNPNAVLFGGKVGEKC